MGLLCSVLWVWRSPSGLCCFGGCRSRRGMWFWTPGSELAGDRPLACLCCCLRKGSCILQQMCTRYLPKLCQGRQERCRCCLTQAERGCLCLCSTWCSGMGDKGRAQQSRVLSRAGRARGVPGWLEGGIARPGLPSALLPVPGLSLLQAAWSRARRVLGSTVQGAASAAQPRGKARSS